MKKILLNLLILTGFVLLSQWVYAQTGVRGEVKDSQSKETLIGATVMLQGTSMGAATDMDGRFLLEGPAGSYKLDISYVGYDTFVLDVTIKEGETTNLGTINLEASAIGLAGVRIVADRARERETPVAYSNVERKQIQQQLGSRDIPMIMNVTPSVYATQQGGGAGDARVNVRGFNQQNVAIMINGVPVNDMENGWVYWSNWDGVGDATSSIQMQRGLSAVNLATPSIGGTMNVITNPAEQKAGFTYKQEFGSGRFYKSTVFGHTGLIKGKYAFSAGGVRKVGDGVIDKTWTDAWAYYLGASWNINSKNRLELYAIGAPQKHGQNSYKQNIAAYSHDYAKDLGFPAEALEKFPEASSIGDYSGRYYNENWGPVDYKYQGQQYYNGSYHKRHDPHFINERENYYHKPLVNINWYSQFSDKLSLYTVAYYSGGMGGGTGTFGSMRWDYSGPSRMVDFDATIARNDTSGTGSYGILRNSVNNQWTLGLTSKLKWNTSEKFKMSFGIDGRTATIDHFREVRDLLGGSYFSNSSDQFSSTTEKYLGDKIDYNFTNKVNWFGGYAQGEYNYGNVTAYAMAGYSVIKYNYTNHFRKAEGSEDKLTAESDFIGGYQIKGGANYRFAESFNVFANAGYVSKVPIFDNVINDRTGVKYDETENEKFTSFELGVNYITNKVTGRLNYYYTNWKDRAALYQYFDQATDEEYDIFMRGIDALHTGIELEGAYQPFDVLRFDLGMSFGNWKTLDDIEGTSKNYSYPDSADVFYKVYVKDLKVGDAPQTQIALGLTVIPSKGFTAQLIGRYYANHYADWNPFSRLDENDRTQVWKTPDYAVFDLNLSYDLPLKGGVGVQVFLHIFNLFDEIYVQDALDNSDFNGYYGDNNEYSHQGPAAEVYLGIPTTYNFGLILNL